MVHIYILRAVETWQNITITASHRESSASLIVQYVRNLPAVQETQVPSLGLGRSPGEGNGNQLQYSFLKNLMVRGAWQATVQRITKSQMFVCAKSLQLYLTLCNPMDCSRPGSSVCGILQARILEWVVMPFSRRSSQPRD